MNKPVPILHCYGAGRAARTLLRLLHRAGQVRIGCVVNRSLPSAQAAVAFIGAGQATTNLPLEAAGDGLLLGCPESVLAEAAQQIIAAQTCHGLAFAFHLSASMDSSVLTGLAPALASCHPALAFAHPEQALTQFAGSWCVLEGTPELLVALRSWLQVLEAKVLAVPNLDKRQYHAAAMAASNFMLACLGLAERLAERAGLPASEAHALLSALALRNLHAAAEVGAAAAFTGPLERGDSAALERILTHLASIASGSGESVDALPTAAAQLQMQFEQDYHAWASLLALGLPLVESKGKLHPDALTQLRKLLPQ